MSISPTTSVIAADFYRIAEAFLVPHLGESRWQLVDRASFLKREEDGVSRLALDLKKGGQRFTVMVTFEPLDMLEVMSELYGEESPAEGGFLCGPYLKPGGVYPRHGGYGCRTRASLEASLAQVVEAVDQEVGPWLKRLREPVFLASEADPVAALMCGYAWERAGDVERAREHYEEMWRRLQECLELESARMTLDDTRPSSKRSTVAGRQPDPTAFAISELSAQTARNNSAFYH